MSNSNLLRIMTCGSVDDGKSTLIGRLLFEAGAIYEDQLRSLKTDSKKFGTRGEEIDYALLLDGLSSEREQGITIDVAYRYFSTIKRRFIIADCPGHEEYTRNMATAASKSELAILLVNASQGLQIQTLRHAKIASILGIKHLILALNKMDMVGFDEKIFNQINQDFLTKTQGWGFSSIILIPVSAIDGDNLTHKSDRTPWYQGETLLKYLEQADVTVNIKEPFRFPIQWVNRPNSDFRGYSGTMVSGSVSVGDEIIIPSSKQKAHIKEIVTFDGNVQSAEAGKAITLTLDREIDASRGDVLVGEDEAMELGHNFEATLFWMSSQTGHRGRSYEMKLNSQVSQGSITNLKSKLNLTKLIDTECKSIELNDIVQVNLSTSRPVLFTKYADNKEMGSFILIDKMTNATLAAGIITHALRRGENITAQKLSITKTQREELGGHKARVIWMTGLSGSGKSTLANALEIELHQRGQHTYILDGDNIRMGLNKDLSFTDADRIENIRRIAEVAKLMMDAGLVVITAFISPFEDDRRMARELIGEENFHEIFISTPLEICEKRDVKGLYKKARSGKIPNLSGINSGYEKPLAPTLEIDTNSTSVPHAVSMIIKKIF